MKNYLKSKIDRLLVSKNTMKIIYFYHYLTGGFNSKNIEVNFKEKLNRKEIVQKIIEFKKFKKYLEIGTFKNDLFNYIDCEKKIGVDPFSGGNVRKTSDEFFADNTKKFDLIFIDGLHHYDQVKKDILNSISILENNGIILMHDCMPRDYYYQAVPRSQFNWNGDTWKAFLEIRSNDNYDSYCCYADEGIGVILKRPNRNKLNFNIEKFKNFNFNLYVENYQKFLNLIEYEELIKIVKSYE